MIVLAVLGVLSVLLVVVLNLAADATLAQQMLVRAQTSDRAYQVAVATAARSLEVFRNQDPKVITLLDPWAQDPPPQHLDTFWVQVHLSDEECLFNPNAMLGQDGSPRDEQVQVFRRLLLHLDHKEDFSNAVLDWLDTDSTRREPMGAENLDYKERRPKNQLLDSPQELQWIQGVTQSMLEPRTRSDRPLPPLTALLTTQSAGFVNVNTADPWVLGALAPGFRDEVVSAIVEARRTRPFQTVDDMFGVPGVTRDDLFYVKKVADTKSGTWRVEVTVTPDEPTDDGALRLTAVYRRTSKGFTPLSWNLADVHPEALTSTTMGASKGASTSPSPSPRPGPSVSPRPSSPPSLSDGSPTIK